MKKLNLVINPEINIIIYELSSEYSGEVYVNSIYIRRENI